MSAASTPTDTFVFIRCARSPVIAVTRPVTMATHSMQTAAPHSMDSFPLPSTGPVSAFVIRGISIPIPVPAREARTTKMISDSAIQFFI